MSHEQVLEFAGKCPIAMEAACKKLGFAWKGYDTAHEQYVRKYEGYAIRPPGFYYDVVVDMDGKIRADEDDTKHDVKKQQQIKDFRIAYYEAVAEAKAEAEGGTITRTVLENGAIEIDIEIGGGTTELGNEPPKFGGTSAPTL